MDEEPRREGEVHEDSRSFQKLAGKAGREGEGSRRGERGREGRFVFFGTEKT